MIEFRFDEANKQKNFAPLWKKIHEIPGNVLGRLFGYSVIVISIHVRQFVSVAPIGSGCVCDRLVVATNFFKEEAHVFLSNNAYVKNKRRLKKVCDNVNVKKKVVFQPREDEENPSNAHCYEHQNKHDEAEMIKNIILN